MSKIGIDQFEHNNVRYVLTKPIVFDISDSWPVVFDNPEFGLLGCGCTAREIFAQLGEQLVIMLELMEKDGSGELDAQARIARGKLRSLVSKEEPAEE